MKQFALCCILLSSLMCWGQTDMSLNYGAGGVLQDYDISSLQTTTNTWHLIHNQPSTNFAGYECTLQLVTANDPTGNVPLCYGWTSAANTNGNGGNAWTYNITPPGSWQRMESTVGNVRQIAVRSMPNNQYGAYWMVGLDYTHPSNCSNNFGYGYQAWARDSGGGKFLLNPSGSVVCVDKILIGSDGVIDAINHGSASGVTQLINWNGSGWNIESLQWSQNAGYQSVNDVAVQDASHKWAAMADGTVWALNPTNFSVWTKVTGLPLSSVVHIAVTTTGRLIIQNAASVYLQTSPTAWRNVTSYNFTNLTMKTASLIHGVYQGKIYRLPMTGYQLQGTVFGNGICTSGTCSGIYHDVNVRASFGGAYVGGTKFDHDGPYSDYVNGLSSAIYYDPIMCLEEDPICSAAVAAEASCPVVGADYMNPPVNGMTGCVIPQVPGSGWSPSDGTPGFPNINVYFDKRFFSGTGSGMCPGTNHCAAWTGVSSWSAGGFRNYTDQGLYDVATYGLCHTAYGLYIPCGANIKFPLVFVTQEFKENGACSGTATACTAGVNRGDTSQRGDYSVIVINPAYFGNDPDSLGVMQHEGAHEEGHNNSLGDCCWSATTPDHRCTTGSPQYGAFCSQQNETQTVMWWQAPQSDELLVPTSCDLLNAAQAMF